MYAKENLRISFIILFLSLLLLFTLAYSQASTDKATIYWLKFDSSVNPVTKDYVLKNIKRANQEGAVAIVIQLDTPGGLGASMRKIVQAMLNSSVPTIVYVAPAGARAGSAGVFITLAADIAVMASGTNIGAAHPVNLGGESQDEDQPTTEKAVEDTAAFARSLAEQQGRNVEWAENAVRESSSITASEALKQNVIDFMAQTRGELLEKIDGYKFEEARQQVKGISLDISGANIKEIQMGLRERLLNYLADPNIVYFLLMIGLYGLIYEFFQPGIGFGLAAGGVCLLLAFLGLQILPINLVGVGLLFFGALLMVLDAFTPTHGILTTGGVVSLLFGSFTLFDIESPAISLDWWTVTLTVGTVTLLFVFIISKGLLVQSRKVTTGVSGMIGAVGVAREDIYGAGKVFVKGELWTAQSPYNEEIKKGDEVIVEQIKDGKLVVRRR